MNFFKKREVWLFFFVLVLSVAYLFFDSSLDFNYIIPNRVSRLLVMSIGGACIALSSMIFQTITENKMLAPSIMGYESIYILFQSLLVFFLGMGSAFYLNEGVNFILSSLVIIVFSWLVHHFMMKKEEGNVYSLLLFGLVLTLVITSFNQLIQFSISPGEFSMLMSYSQASFNRSTGYEILLSLVVIVAISIYIYRATPLFDVLLMGRYQSKSLGLDYGPVVKKSLFMVSILVAISTSLIGPTAFMGILVANMAYFLSGSPKHKSVLSIGVIFSIGIFVIAQILVEHVFNYKTTVGILVNLMCGFYFIILVISQRRLA